MPEQVTPPVMKRGVTVIVAITTVLPVFVAVKDGILPVPDAPRPIVELLFVQANTVPGTEPVKFTAVVAEPLQTT